MIGIPSNLANEHDATFDAIMVDYAAGNLSCAQTLLVDSYLTLNPSARATSLACASMGGELLESECAPETVSNKCLSNILETIEADTPFKSKPATSCMVQPNPLTHYTNCGLDDIQWKTLAPGIDYFDIPVPCNKREKAQLLRMAPGKSVLEHSHDGLELTLVLDGAFHDNTGSYHRGDLAVEEGHNHAHKPIADDTHGCVCLAVTSAPLHFTGILGTLINPFVR